MMTIPYTQILVLIAFAIFFHHAAEMEENAPSWIWSSLSILISAVTMFWFGWGWLGIILAQIGLFFGITLVKMLREK